MPTLLLVLWGEKFSFFDEQTFCQFFRFSPQVSNKKEDKLPGSGSATGYPPPPPVTAASLENILWWVRGLRRSIAFEVLSGCEFGIQECPNVIMQINPQDNFCKPTFHSESPLKPVCVGHQGTWAATKSFWIQKTAYLKVCNCICLYFF